MLSGPTRRTPCCDRRIWSPRVGVTLWGSGRASCDRIAQWPSSTELLSLRLRLIQSSCIAPLQVEVGHRPLSGCIKAMCSESGMPTIVTAAM
jgi:hypothetical protein